MRGSTAAALLTAIVIAFARHQATSAQAPPAPAAFDVASIKPNKDGGPSSVRATPNGTLTITNNTLRNVIRNAYGLPGAQIVGGPGWLDADRFDITAKASQPFTQPEGMAMVRGLLAERFSLTTHTEMRPMPVYALVLAAKDGVLGPRMHRSSVDCEALRAAVVAGGPMPAPGPNGSLPCGLNMRPGTITGSAVAMEQLARNLVAGVGRIVVDKTGLSGYFDLDVTFAAEPITPSPAGTDAPAADPSAPSLFTALQEQLGLKLEPSREPVEVLVIDRAERPSAN